MSYYFSVLEYIVMIWRSAKNEEDEEFYDAIKEAKVRGAKLHMHRFDQSPKEYQR